MRAGREADVQPPIQTRKRNRLLVLLALWSYGQAFRLVQQIHSTEFCADLQRRAPVQRAVGADVIVVFTPCRQLHPCVGNSVSFRNSSRKRPMWLSAKAFCTGLPG